MTRRDTQILHVTRALAIIAWIRSLISDDTWADGPFYAGVTLMFGAALIILLFEINPSRDQEKL